MLCRQGPSAQSSCHVCVSLQVTHREYYVLTASGTLSPVCVCTSDGAAVRCDMLMCHQDWSEGDNDGFPGNVGTVVRMDDRGYVKVKFDGK